jgi:LacI family transcriptional regulator
MPGREDSTGDTSLRIGLVFSYGLDYCRRILRGVRDYAQGRRTWAFVAHDAEPRAVQALRSARVRGVIAHVTSRPLANALARLRVPVVNVAGVLPGLRLPRVAVDNVQVGRLAAEHLLDHGLRHFAFVGHPRHEYAVRRAQGFAERLAVAGVRPRAFHPPPGTRFDPTPSLSSADPRLERWLSGLSRPSGVFASNDLWGLQVSEACRRLGLRVPDDVAIVGVDDDELLCELAHPPLSSVAVPAERVGYEAAALLDGLLQGRTAPRQPVLLMPIGVVRRQSSDVLAIADADVAAALRFIRSPAARSITVADVLAAVPVSRRGLERRFRRLLGRGIWAEIRRVRLDRARTLLAGSDLPISRVATHAGFSDGKQLSVVFRQETGLTPTQYRRRSRSSGTA